MYSERPSSVDGTVVWTRRGAAPRLILPDGCTDIIWSGTALTVAGPDTTARAPQRADGPFTGLRFGPGLGPVVLGVPAYELRDHSPALDALWPAAEVRRLTERIALAADPAAALEAAVHERMRGQPTLAPVVGHVVSALRAGRRVATIAADVELSRRQLQRLSLAAFGYGAKFLGRVLRLQHALALAQAGTALADAAARAGYADQAHLARDARALTGTSMGELTRS